MQLIVEIEEEEQQQMLIEENRDTMEPIYHKGVAYDWYLGVLQIQEHIYDGVVFPHLLSFYNVRHQRFRFRSVDIHISEYILLYIHIGDTFSLSFQAPIIKLQHNWAERWNIVACFTSVDGGYAWYWQEGVLHICVGIFCFFCQYELFFFMGDGGAERGELDFIQAI